jgi:hypothetical protein
MVVLRQLLIYNVLYYLILRSVQLVRGLGYGLGDWVSIPGRNNDLFCSTPRPDRLWWPIQLPIQWVPGALSPGVKRLGRKLTAHFHLVPKVKNSWSPTSTPFVFLAWCVIKQEIHLHGAVLSFIST